MKSFGYLLLLQMLIGIWLFISSLAMHFKDLAGVAFMDMMFGAIVAIIGLGVFLRETYFPEWRRQNLHLSFPHFRKL